MPYVEGTSLPSVFVENGLAIVEDFAPDIFSARRLLPLTIPFVYEAF